LVGVGGLELCLSTQKKVGLPKEWVGSEVAAHGKNVFAPSIWQGGI